MMLVISICLQFEVGLYICRDENDRWEVKLGNFDYQQSDILGRELDEISEAHSGL